MEPDGPKAHPSLISVPGPERLKTADAKGATEYAVEYERTTTQNLEALVPYVVALQTLEAFDCFLHDKPTDCNAAPGCRWYNEVDRCLSQDAGFNREAKALRHELQQKKKKLQNDGGKRLELKDRIRLDVLSVLHELESGVLAWAGAFQRFIAQMRRELAEDVRTIEGLSMMMPSDPAVPAQRQKVQQAGRRIDNNKKQLRKKVDEIRYLTQNVDNRTIQLLEEWQNEVVADKAKRTAANPLVWCKTLVSEADDLVAEYARKARLVPQPKSGWFKWLTG